ncbi:hypothetical protein AKJ16_DCAP19998 [Drosera capensis]
MKWQEFPQERAGIAYGQFKTFRKLQSPCISSNKYSASIKKTHFGGEQNKIEDPSKLGIRNMDQDKTYNVIAPYYAEKTWHP